MEGWISLHRKFINWEWYDDINTKCLFIHCLLKANHKGKKWRGIEIKRGSFLTSRSHLSLEMGLSEQQIRTAIKKLTSTNEITIESTNLNTLISIVNWSKYQNSNQQTTNKQPADNQRATTTNNDNNKNNVNNDNKLLTEIDISELNEKEVYYYNITMSFYELFKENLKEKKISTTKLETAKYKWSNHIRLLIEKDNYTHDDLTDVWKFLKINDFWKKNILSTSKLREQFQRIIMESRENNPSKSNNKDAAMHDYKKKIVDEINETS